MASVAPRVQVSPEKRWPRERKLQELRLAELRRLPDRQEALKRLDLPQAESDWSPCRALRLLTMVPAWEPEMLPLPAGPS
jgi:hypothetical protein